LVQKILVVFRAWSRSKAENISAIRCLNVLGRPAREFDPENLPPDLARQAVVFWDALQAGSTVAASRA
jgi:hypothetical protein